MLLPAASSPVVNHFESNFKAVLSGISFSSALAEATALSAASSDLGLFLGIKARSARAASSVIGARPATGQGGENALEQCSPECYSRGAMESQISPETQGVQFAPAPVSLTRLNTAELIDYLRQIKGYTITEIGCISGTPRETVKCWAAGTRTPPEAKRIQFAKAFAEAPPSRKRESELQWLHGLTWDKSKGRWKLRLTLDMGRKVVGKRISIPLRTADEKVAIQKRDGIVEGYRRIGLTVRGRALPRKDTTPK